MSVKVQNLLKLIETLEDSDKQELSDELKKIVTPPEDSDEPWKSEDEIKCTSLELQRSYNALRSPRNFEEGDLVRWKAGLKNRKLPRYNEPAVVVEVLHSMDQVFSSDDPRSNYFREPLDVILGIIRKGDLVTFYMDSRKFERYRHPWEA